MTRKSDVEYLLMAYRKATESPDPSTQNGAVIICDSASEVVAACNDFPAGVVQAGPRLERPQKYAFVEHAERAVIFRAARRGLPLAGATMYCPWFACADCARAIIAVGIRRVVGHQRMMDETPEHWKQTIADAFAMLREAGVETELVANMLGGPEIRFNGRKWTP